MWSQEKRNTYENAWNRVKRQYLTGCIVSERGLQAALVTELSRELTENSSIVVEPKWPILGETSKTPDLVLVEEDQITDIFELKFVPHSYAKWQYDLTKLRSYVRTPNAQYPVFLHPKTGQWENDFTVKSDYRLHFVAVSKYNSKAVSPLPDSHARRINHWYGRTGEEDGEWGIRFVCDQ